MAFNFGCAFARAATVLEPNERKGRHAVRRAEVRSICAFLKAAEGGRRAL
jgi:hypothetical protein